MSEVQYRYVTIEDPAMRLAYDVAKAFYRINQWNKKTCPIAVIVKGTDVLAVGVSGDGMHQMTGACDRLDKPKSSYSECKWCVEALHAEQDALRKLKIDPQGASCYLYGHWHMCSACRASMEAVGIKDFVLLKGSEVLFDRHSYGTVVGTPGQFTL